MCNPQACIKVCVKMMVYKYLLKNIWSKSSDNNARVCKPEYIIRSVWYNLVLECLLGCIIRVNTIPPYSVILTITVLLNGFNNNKKLVFF
jgi:hypothetical protein